MALCKALFMTVAMAIAVVGALLPATALAEVYKVGGDASWNRGVDYEEWASGKTFHVNDKLEFEYSTGYHNVAVVDEASYEACTLPMDLKTTLTSGHEFVTFASAGKWFFISSILYDCDSGMKLAVDVQ